MKRATRLALAALVLGAASMSVHAVRYPIETASDLCPTKCTGTGSFSSIWFASSPDSFYFVGNDPKLGQQIFAIDAATRDVRRITSLRSVLYGEPYQLVVASGTLFFKAPPPENSPAVSNLWRSDGTLAGTAYVHFPAPADYADLQPGGVTSRGLLLGGGDAKIWWIEATGPPRLVVNGRLRSNIVERLGSIYFVAGQCIVCMIDPAPTLYRFNPPATLTTLAPLSLSPDASFITLAASPAGIFFQQDVAELYFTSGTAPPGRIATWPASGFVALRTSKTHGGALHFEATLDARHGEIVRSDGTSAGTLPTTRMSAAQAEPLYPMVAGEAAGELFVVVTSRVSAPYPDAPYQPRLPQLWVLDSADPWGMRAIRAVNRRGSDDSLSPLYELLDGIVFRGTQTVQPDDDYFGVWFSDGTPGGTQMLDAAPLEGLTNLRFVGVSGHWMYFYGELDHVDALYRWNVGPGNRRVYRSVDVVEYHHAQLDHYFMTADPAEIALLDSGSTKGWARTGFGFAAYASDSGAPRASPVCRFYGRPEAHLDSHFYTASPAECTDVERNFGAAWVKESSNVFEVELPDASTGACASGTSPVYRAFNGRADANHRYSMHADDQKRMQQKSWIPEGSTSAGITMCVLVGRRPASAL